MLKLYGMSDEEIREQSEMCAIAVYAMAHIKDWDIFTTVILACLDGRTRKEGRNMNEVWGELIETHERFTGKSYDETTAC